MVTQTGLASALRPAALAWAPPPDSEDYSRAAWWVVPASLASPWLPLGAVVAVLDELPAAQAIDVELRFSASAGGQQ